MEEGSLPFIIGQHESERALPVSPGVVQLAHGSNYDMLTSPITTPHFHSRVLALLSSSLSEAGASYHDGRGSQSKIHHAKPLAIPPLSPVDTPLTPDEGTSKIVAVSSTWTDLCSPDPFIAAVSQDILKLEIAYAAFCGISYVLIPGPRLRQSSMWDGSLARYARAILEVLDAGPYIQLQIWTPIIDHPRNTVEQIGDLAPFARSHFVGCDLETTPQKLDLFGTWSAWNLIRSLCKYHSRLCVALSLPKLLPPVAIQARWHSEPVRMLTLDAESFTRNPKGYPVLSKAHQAFVSRFMRLRTRPWLLLCDVGPIPGLIVPTANGISTAAGPALTSESFPTLAEAFTHPGTPEKFLKDPTPHLRYLRNFQTKQPWQSPLERFGAGYQDYLQAPLQPLTVNLESITYEVFEKDPVKYDWYGKAIARALHDWIEQGKPTSNADGRVVVAVVGAGRGPLVTRALRASEDVGVDIDIWALEKNSNAFVLLQRHNEEIWDNQVNLVKSDMRTWKGPFRKASEPIPPAVGPDTSIELAKPSSTGDTRIDRDSHIGKANAATATYAIDILISELLGSFADNELSPECLDGVQHLLNPTHGISIPSSYTAHLTPVAAPKLHADIVSQSISNPNAPETPFVVMLHAIDYLSTTISSEHSASPERPASQSNDNTAHLGSGSSQTLEPVVETAWAFSHPSPHISSSTITTNEHNMRHCTLRFPVSHRGICHGLAGYFEAVLYGKVQLSTNPTTMEELSDGMISWFPMYFPLKTPLYVPDNGELVVNMWRQSDDRKIWYEWMVESFGIVPGKGKEAASVAPSSGRRFRVGASELHSSIKEACLM